MKIVGNLICQNGIYEILKAIESVLPVVDAFYILDGGSTDGTWELLQKFRDQYHLTLFQHPYDNLENQRNRLLSKTPKNVWVVSIDQDEKLNSHLQKGLREYLDRVSPALYCAEDRHLPLNIPIKHVNLIKDTTYFTDSWTGNLGGKIFYNDRNLHFAGDYHCIPRYFDTETNTNGLPGDDTWIVFHFMLTNPYRWENLQQDIESGKRSYGLKEFDMEGRDITKLPLEWL